MDLPVLKKISIISGCYLIGKIRNLRRVAIV